MPSILYFDCKSIKKSAALLLLHALVLGHRCESYRLELVVSAQLAGLL